MLGAVRCLTFVLCVNGIAVADAAYIITLKNGKEYVTNRYWQEGLQVLFDAEGGVFGIEKGFIRKIEKADRVIKLATVAPNDASEGIQTEGAKLQEERKAAIEPTPRKERNASDPIANEFNRLKAKAMEVDGMLTSEIRELLDQITAFRSKLLKDSKLFIEYPYEVHDISDIKTAVENVFRARNN